MKFRNITGDALVVHGLGVAVKAGETTDDIKDESVIAGLILQDATWHAVGADRKKQEAAIEAAYQTDDEPVSEEKTDHGSEEKD